MRARTILALGLAALSATGALAGIAVTEASSTPAALIPNSVGHSEPSIDFMPNGREFVTAIPGIIIGAVPLTKTPIYENVSGTWTVRSSGVTMTGDVQGGGDSDIEFDSQGRGYFADLYLANDDVAVSADGVTWIASPAGHYTSVVDRQWFAHDKDQYVYLITNQNTLVGVNGLPNGEGAVSFRYEVGTPLGQLGGLMAPVETPLICSCGPPGVPSVDQNTGNLYVPMWRATGLVVYRSLDHGLTFSQVNVPGNVPHDDLEFAVSAVDAAGNVYVVYDHNAGTQKDVYLTVSTDQGAHYSVPVKVSSTTGTHIMPWVVAGAAGKIAVLWYETSKVGDNNDNNAFSGVQWTITYAESTNANATAPTFTRYDLDGVYHVGSIDTIGLQSVTGGGPDRSLGDFFSASIKPTTGEVFVASARTHVPGRTDGVYVVRMPAGASTLN